jgi:hypothetical protein
MTLFVLGGAQTDDVSFMRPHQFDLLAQEYDRRYGLDHEHLAGIAELNYATPGPTRTRRPAPGTSPFSVRATAPTGRGEAAPSYPLLAGLTDAGVLRKVPDGGRPSYRLTASGKDLWALLLSIWAREQQWVQGSALSAMRHLTCGEVFRPVCAAWPVLPGDHDPDAQPQVERAAPRRCWARRLPWWPTGCGPSWRSAWLEQDYWLTSNGEGA